MKQNKTAQAGMAERRTGRRNITEPAGRSIGAATALTTMLLLAAACDTTVETRSTPPEEVAEADAATTLASAFCELLFSCSCSELDYATQAECEQAEQEIFAALQEDAQAAGLTYDGVCLAEKIAAMGERGCTTYGQVRHDLDFQPGCSWSEQCPTYYGAIGEDTEYCDRYGAWTNCEAGLACRPFEGGDGKCHSDCPTIVFADGEPCSQVETPGLCEPTSYCDEDGTGLCTLKPPVGEPCGNGSCAYDAWCDGEDHVCKTRRADGEPCTNIMQCASYGCDDGLCGLGEAYICMRSTPPW